jgi:transcriptional regulator with XRE-family HTH domain
MEYVGVMLSRKISGQKLRRVREDRCLSVAELADAVGCTPSNIYKIEIGSHQPSATSYAALKRVLDVRDEDLAVGDAEAAAASVGSAA